jgi:transcriptional regulator with XRE-family HTH domain
MVYNLGERISSLRKEMNLSQEALAERVGVTRQAISKWERDEATPDIYNLSSLAESFGLSIDELLTDDIYSLMPNQPKVIGTELKLRAQKMIMIGVGLFIVSPFIFVAAPIITEVKFAMFALLIASGVLLMIKAGFLFEKFNSLNKDYLERKNEESYTGPDGPRKKQKEAVNTIVSVSCTIIYLYLGFFHMLWHPGWLIFMIIPVFNGIYDLIIIKKEA